MSTLGLVSFRVLIDGATGAMRRHFRAMLLPAALPLAAAGSLFGLFHLRLMGDLLSVEADFDPTQLVVMVAAFFGYFLVYGLALYAVTAAAMDGVSGRPVSMSRAWLFVLQPKAFLTLIMVALLVGVSMLFCIFPVFYVGAALSFVTPVMLDERRFGLKALHRSMELANFNPSREFLAFPWLQACAVLFVGMVVAYVLAAIVQLPFNIIQWFFMFRETSQGGEPDMAALLQTQTWLLIPATVAGAFAAIIAHMYQAFALCVLFLEVRRRKEGQDIETAIEEMTAPAAGAPPHPASEA